MPSGIMLRGFWLASSRCLIAVSFPPSLLVSHQPTNQTTLSQRDFFLSPTTLVHSSFLPPPNMRGSISDWAQWLRALVVDFVDMVCFFPPKTPTCPVSLLDHFLCPLFFFPKKSTTIHLEFLTTAKRFLLNWTFFGSLVTRDMAFKSANSFSTFQTLRMFTEEYCLFLLESRMIELKKLGAQENLLSYFVSGFWVVVFSTSVELANPSIFLLF